MTENETYLNKLVNLSLSEIDTSFIYATCDHDNADFDCNNISGNDQNETYKPTSARRQGLIIYSFWTSYQTTGNSSIREIAENYTKGSAENCDVWNYTNLCERMGEDNLTCSNITNQTLCGDFNCNWSNTTSTCDGATINNTCSGIGLKNSCNHYTQDICQWNYNFDCGNSDDQGLMTLAYWKAYEQSGNETYFEIAENLSSVGLDYANSTYLALGFWKGYEISGNETYFGKGVNLSDWVVNQNYTGFLNQSIGGISLLKGYEQSGYSGYLEKAKNLSGKINSRTNETFSNADEQGSSVWFGWYGYQVFPTNKANLYGNRFPIIPKTGNNLDIKLNFKGIIENPKICYNKINSSENFTCSGLSSNLIGTIPQSYLTEQTIYKYYFNYTSNGTEKRFPNGNFSIALSAGEDYLKENATNFTLKNNTRCDVWNDDYSCNYEDYQGLMILGFSNAYLMTENETYLNKLVNLSLGEIEEEGNTSITATCDHYEGYFDCKNKTGNEGSIYIPTSARRQGMMIYSFWTSYQTTKDSRIKDIAENYTRGSAENCDVWNNGFNCGNSDDQGLMTLAYWKAYEQSGNETYFDIAENLSSVALDYANSSYLALGFWKGYEISGNETYFGKSVNLSDWIVNQNYTGFLDRSIGGISLLKGYEISGNITYRVKAKSLSESINSRTNETSFDADEQGSSVWFGWYGYQVFPKKSMLEINLTIPDSATKGNSFDAICAVNNTGENNITNITISFSLSEGLSASDNLTELVSILRPQNLTEHKISVNTNQNGEQWVYCSASAKNSTDFDSYNQTITINIKKEENGGGGGSSGGGTATTPKNESKIIIIHYNFTEYSEPKNVSNFIEKSVSVKKFLKDFTASYSKISEETRKIADCLYATRTINITGNSTKVKLIIFSNCSIPENLHFYDKIPRAETVSAGMTWTYDGYIFKIIKNGTEVNYFFNFSVENFSKPFPFVIPAIINKTIPEIYDFNILTPENASMIIKPLVTETNKSLVHVNESFLSAILDFINSLLPTAFLSQELKWVQVPVTLEFINKKPLSCHAYVPPFNKKFELSGNYGNTLFNLTEGNYTLKVNCDYENKTIEKTAGFSVIIAKEPFPFLFLLIILLIIPAAIRVIHYLKKPFSTKHQLAKLNRLYKSAEASIQKGEIDEAIKTYKPLVNTYEKVGRLLRDKEFEYYKNILNLLSALRLYSLLELEMDRITNRD
ncbi:MAG: hypothetical protein KAU95_00920, partial [Candidatus Aenigmarchaeota archaeon]|nr:hypothetical protein [Candidatus Aenigmarchaeota archaeon]